jgi:hypothetical protein
MKEILPRIYADDRGLKNGKLQKAMSLVKAQFSLFGCGTKCVIRRGFG